MIGHHQAAVSSAQDALLRAAHPELVDFAETIITIRGEEIATMTRWLTENDAK